MTRFEEAVVFYNVLLQYTAHEACWAVGIWEKVPSVSLITQAQFQKLLWDSEAHLFKTHVSSLHGDAFCIAVCAPE